MLWIVRRNFKEKLKSFGWKFPEICGIIFIKNVGMLERNFIMKILGNWRTVLEDDKKIFWEIF